MYIWKKERMDLPVFNIVSEIDLKPQDVLLPLYEAVVNAVISLQQDQENNNKKIQIKVERSKNSPVNPIFGRPGPIDSLKVIDNGPGFNKRNFKSYKTAYSRANKKFGCKGIGRFTILAAFKEITIDSTYRENGHWENRKFRFSTENEVESVSVQKSDNKVQKTIISLNNFYNQELVYASQLDLIEIAEGIMNHCLIYYLSGELPLIEIIDTHSDNVEVVNDLYTKLSTERERTFNVAGETFNCYITKNARTSNRKNHYIHYCANSRVVGRGKNLARVNSLFIYPIFLTSKPFFLDVYVTGEYLDKNVYSARNGFKIPTQRDNSIFSDSSLSFEDIEIELSSILTEQYDSYVKETQEKSKAKIRRYILEEAPRYRRFAGRDDILNAIPPNLPPEKLEAALYQLAYKEQVEIEKNIENFIEKKEFGQEAINAIKEELADKAAYDSDALADYLFHRKAIIKLFKKFLEADRDGKYKLEEDIHNLIFPMGLIQDEGITNTHNLWLLDERFATYSFIASDKSITSFSQKKSRNEPDLLILNQNPKMFDNPLSFGTSSSGEIQTMVIFEFKRPGETAHQKRKNDKRWEFSELIEKYFDDFLYGDDKKNYKGRPVVIHRDTPKFGYVIVDVIPPLLKEYNEGKGYRRTPFGTYYKIYPDLNMHIEVVTFEQLIRSVEDRHNPLFDKLFIVTN